MGIVSALRNRLMPPLPDSVRDAFTLLQFRRLQRQVPTLYATLILIVGAATMIAGKNLPFWLRVGIPAMVGLVALARLTVWMGRRNRTVSTEQAGRLIRTMVIVSSLIAIACSFWCVYSWTMAEPANKIYFPLFISMGSLSTAYCISTVRIGAMLTLLIGMVPINGALLLYGNSMDVAAAGSMLIACAFLIRMIQQQHDVLRDLLLLQNDMHSLATTDPLTGLLNRRALNDLFEAELASYHGHHGPVIALLDLDGFKPVNDRHGHAAGDELLRGLARRLQAVVTDRADVARLGGDEFAIMIKAAHAGEADALAHQMLSSLAAPFNVGPAAIRVGASLGLARWNQDGRTLDDLFATADRALYASKTRDKPEAPSAALLDHPILNALVKG